MQGRGENTKWMRMAEMRLDCQRETPTQQNRIDSSINSYCEIRDSSKSATQKTIQIQAEQLGKLRAELREADDALVKVLSVKIRKEARRMSFMESISDAKARVQEMQRSLDVQRARKDEYAAIILQQSKALATCNDKCDENREHIEELKEAISWYNRVLGFRIGCGNGVKFIFANISPQNPDEEYSFTIRHENGIYTLPDCNPHLSDIKEAISELNKTNGLSKFVRILRQKFQEVAARGISGEESAIVSVSGPVASVSTDPRYESPVSQAGIKSAESGSSSRIRKGKQEKHPQRSSSVRRSSRLKGQS